MFLFSDPFHCIVILREKGINALNILFLIMSIINLYSMRIFFYNFV
jgi:hypothetical protein